MAFIHINHFMGMAPRYGERKLSPNQAIEAINIDLFSREIKPIRTNLEVDNPTKSGTIKTIYPLNGKWLHWTTDVDVVPAPLQTEQDGRIYFTGDYNPKSSNNTLATVGAGTDYPLDFYRLGLPSPENAPTVGITGGSSGVPESRDYVYTFVTAWGEEGPPSPVTTYLAAHDDATQWDISGMDTAPLNTGVISGAVHSAGVVTVTVTADHFLETGDYVDIDSVAGMTDLNGRFQATRISATQFSVVLSTAQTYTSGGTWTREAPIQTASMTKNLYRSVSGTYKLVASGISGSTYTDTVADADLGESLPSTYWTSPNGDLSGLIALPNGALAGFYGNVLAFSEPYFPHAWPSTYEIPLPYEIVALGAVGNSIIVATKQYPYIVTGYHPESMSDRRLELKQSCVSKRSMQSVLNGVIYACPDGLVYVPVAGIPVLITREWLRKQDWDLYNPSSMHSHTYDDRYYAFYDGGGEEGMSSGAIVFDPDEQESTFTEINIQATAGHSDLESDSLYIMEGSAIKQYVNGGSYQTYIWMSKKFTVPRPCVMKAAKVKLTLGDGVSEAEQAAAIAAAVESVDNDISSNTIMSTGAFSGSTPGTYTVAGGPYFNATKDIVGSVITATMRLYSNGTLKAEKLLVDSNAFRLPLLSKDLSDTYEIEFTGTDVQIHEVTVAETLSELRNV